jgi:hypothetical protein
VLVRAQGLAPERAQVRGPEQARVLEQAWVPEQAQADCH